MDQSPQDTGGTGASGGSSSSSKVALMVVGTVIGHELAPPPPPQTTTEEDNKNSNRPWWQTVLRTGQAIVWQVWNWSWIILHRAMAATSQTLLGYTRSQPPPPAAGTGAGRRPEEVD
jgi:hypothetical protein